MTEKTKDSSAELAAVEHNTGASPTETASDVLRDVLAWAESECPCEDGKPDPCSLCGARADHDHCMAADALFPGVLLARIRKVSRKQPPAALAKAEGRQP
jgi:hypothetical protein